MKPRKSDTFLGAFPDTDEGYEEGKRELEKMAEKLAEQGVVGKFSVFLTKAKGDYKAGVKGDRDEQCWSLFLRDRSNSR
ncbi:hypothetical protein [Streptomyces sp. 5-10]|uniref:hypothetical protein n=1 Tax=Streptomyces sp. 5-10 TaxID=878925 RepID=UPI00168AC810|nr:hypothetical protein [Streptomyces sp. 5-10]MBD3004712.1 hypothetical protein [Streptomyces sp. 5-10]